MSAFWGVVMLNALMQIKCVDKASDPQIPQLALQYYFSFTSTAQFSFFHIQTGELKAKFLDSA